MRKKLSAALALGVSFCLAAAGGQWIKFVAPDGSFSFHYPAGWSVSPAETAVTITHPPTREEMLVVALRYEAGLAPADYARRVLEAMRSETPDLKPSGARQNESSVVFELSYSRAGQRYGGCALVVRNNNTATWFSYSAPAAGYDARRGMDLIRTLRSTIAKGSGSQPPAPAAPLNAR